MPSDDLIGTGSQHIEPDNVTARPNDAIDQLTEKDVNAIDAGLDEAIAANPDTSEATLPDIELKPKTEPKADPAQNDLAKGTPTPAPAKEKPVAKPTEAKVEEKPVAKPEVKPEAIKEEKKDGLPDEPKNMTQQNRDNWKRLREVAETRAKEVETERAEKLALKAELEKAKATKELPPEIKEDYENLKALRALIDIQSDPEFKSQHEIPIQQAEESIYNSLLRHGMPQSTIDQMKKNGGILKVNTDWWGEEVLSKLSEIDKINLANKIALRFDLEEKKGKSVQEYQKNYQGFLDNKVKAHQEHEQAYVRDMQTQAESIRKLFPVAQTKDLTQAKDDAERKIFEQHNAKVKEIEDRFGHALNARDPQTRVQVAAAACLAFVQKEQIEDLQKQITERDAKISAYETEVKKVRVSSSTIKSSRAAAVPKAEDKPSFRPGITTGNRDLNEELEAVMSEAGL